MKRTYKIVLRLLLVGALVFVAYLVYMSYFFELFPYKEIFIEAYRTDKDNDYKAFYVPGNATANNFVIVKKRNEEGTYDFIDSWENYQYLKFIGGDTLKAFIWNDNTLKDTVIIALP